MATSSNQSAPPAAAPDSGQPGGYEVGYGRPPKECQFKPGQRVNLKGQPKHRTHLWTHICRFMAMTPAQIKRLKRNKFTISEKTALRIALAAQRGKGSGAERFARYAVDRDEGRAVEHVVIGEGESLSDEECEELRGLIRETCRRAN